MTPTARTLRLLRAEGWTVAVVERWIERLRIRKDCFGADVLAANPLTKTVLLIQCTTAANLASRVKKVKGLAEVKAWLAAGATFECWGWHRDGRKWAVRRVGITPEMMAVELNPTRRKVRHKQPSLFPEE